MDRKLDTAPKPFGSPDYGKEELVAEMSAAFLSGHAGIQPAVIANQAAYLAGWCKQLKDDKKLVISAAGQAQRAADWIRNERGESNSNVRVENAGEAPPLVQRPEWIDGSAQSAGVDTPDTRREEPPKNWGDPYKPIFSCSGFELGEHRRFKQRVFRFVEKPDAELLATLKEAGFTYRAAEQAWTIPANPDTRKLTDDMARELAGPDAGMSR